MVVYNNCLRINSKSTCKQQHSQLDSYFPYLSARLLPSDRTSLRRGIIRHARMGMDFAFVMHQASICDRTNIAGFFLVERRVRRRQDGRDGPDDRARGVGEGGVCVGVLQSGTSGSVSCFVGIFGHGGSARVRVDDVVVVRGFGVCDGGSGPRGRRW